MTHVRTLSLAPLSLTLLLALAACGGTDTAEAPDTAGADGSSAEGGGTGTAADGFSVTDPWIKAATEDDGMTAAFGEIANGTDTDVTVVAAAHEGAETAELHEVVGGGTEGTMREKEDGFLVPAGGTLPLTPGGDHIMLMGLTGDLEPGSETALTLEFADGSTAEFTAPVKEHAGANEEYEGGDGHEDGDQEHEGDDEHGDH
ncbi:hypothetical protein GCM10007079_10070 [Nocardiopsis terrae]|uniref:Copper(I)-binding protein n=1 Tax=Nocardiopsis terrae TaxID=372655 RepID=A0ABR9HCM5_9ACTN|nr:copper chaperone PCu(A)C [Nocardiopsis terrae]MBE1456777.1 copper(I)-binding protein [Nocardiopsis terrae]GHC75186.1 hypothetical protein GCM10007079_10070 [Nocardiopsis terrae]